MDQLADAVVDGVGEVVVQVVGLHGQPRVHLPVDIDAVATHRVWAIPVFLGMMLAVFLATFSGPGAWMSDGRRG